MCEKQWCNNLLLDHHYMGSGIDMFITKNQDKPPQRKIISICLNRQNCHINTPFDFCLYLARKVKAFHSKHVYVSIYLDKIGVASNPIIPLCSQSCLYQAQITKSQSFIARLSKSISVASLTKKLEDLKDNAQNKNQYSSSIYNITILVNVLTNFHIQRISSTNIEKCLSD